MWMCVLSLLLSGQIERGKDIVCLRLDYVAVSPPWPPYALLFVVSPPTSPSVPLNQLAGISPVRSSHISALNGTEIYVFHAGLVSKVVWFVLGTPHIPGMPEPYGGGSLFGSHTLHTPAARGPYRNQPPASGKNWWWALEMIKRSHQMSSLSRGCRFEVICILTSDILFSQKLNEQRIQGWGIYSC